MLNFKYVALFKTFIIKITKRFSKKEPKYSITPIERSSVKFEFLRRFLKGTVVKDFGSVYLLKNVTAYEVIENLKRADVDHTNNKMLLHGTPVKNSAGILREGFKNSEDGRYGRGLYLTACSDVAITYSDVRNEKDAGKHCIFITEVLNSQDMEYENQWGEPELIEEQRNQKLEEHPFSFFQSLDSEEPEDNEENFKRDEKGRVYRFAPFRRWNVFDEYRVDARLVKPRYYLEFEQTKNEVNLDKWVSYVECRNKSIRALKRERQLEIENLQKEMGSDEQESYEECKNESICASNCDQYCFTEHK